MSLHNFDTLFKPLVTNLYHCHNCFHNWTDYKSHLTVIYQTYSLTNRQFGYFLCDNYYYCSNCAATLFTIFLAENI